MSWKSIPDRSAPQFGIGRASKCRYAFRRSFVIHSGSPLKRLISATISALSPRCAMLSDVASGSFQPYLYESGIWLKAGFGRAMRSSGSRRVRLARRIPTVLVGVTRALSRRGRRRSTDPRGRGTFAAAPIRADGASSGDEDPECLLDGPRDDRGSAKEDDPRRIEPIELTATVGWDRRRLDEDRGGAADGRRWTSAQRVGEVLAGRHVREGRTCRMVEGRQRRGRVVAIHAADAQHATARVVRVER